MTLRNAKITTSYRTTQATPLVSLVVAALIASALAAATPAFAQQPGGPSMAAVSGQAGAAAGTPPGAPPPASAESAELLLARSDKQASAFKDAFFHFKMLIKEPGGQVREVEFTTMQKGQKRLVRFLGPADIKGMGFLSESDSVMYALLPAFGNKIRRLGTSQMNQSFMGSDLSSSDMNAVDLSSLYAAKQIGTEGDQSILELTLKPGKQSDWPRLKLWIETKDAILRKVEYLDATGKKLRTATRADFRKEAGGYATPGRMTYVDHRRNNHETELILLNATFNIGYSDDKFTQRELQRN